jgi:hypothetical protein
MDAIVREEVVQQDEAQPSVAPSSPVSAQTRAFDDFARRISEDYTATNRSPRLQQSLCHGDEATPHEQCDFCCANWLQPASRLLQC